MNQGESTNSIASLDGSSIEKHQIIDSRQINNSYHPPNRPDQQVGPTLRNIQDGANVVSHDPTSSSGATSMAPDYSGYAAYPNTDPYGYSSTGTAAYYNQYQQPPNQYQQTPNQYQQSPNQYQLPPNQYQQPSTQYLQPPTQYQQPSTQYQQPSTEYQQPPNQYQQPSTEYQQPPTQYQQPSTPYQQPSTPYQQSSTPYQQSSTQYQQPSTQYQQPSTSQSFPHQLGAYQNTGAPYNQPLSSFQNTGSSAGPTSYSSTYLGPGDYQTSGNYTSGTYGTQTSTWNGGHYATYSSNQYSNYTPDSNAAYSSSNEQYYKQWEDYYNQTQTEVSCAPGTENISVSSASSVGCTVPSGSTGYAVSNNQMPAVYAPSWRPAEPSSVQPVPASSIQNGLPNPVQPHIQKLPEVIPYGSFQSQQNPTFSRGTTSSYTTSYQVSHSYPSSFQTVSQPSEQIDSRKANKLQIPTNPRIASTLPLGLHKTEKDSYMTSTAVKPAYISVSKQTPAQVKTHDDTESSLKPDMFPKSLLGYVERALARCKDDRQKEASQHIMTKVIKRATDDGTLHTRNWDTEPLFPMPNIDAFNIKDEVEFPVLTSALPNRRSPGRRAKSRWEPISDANLVSKSANTPNGAAKFGGWNKQLFGKISDNKASLGTKFSLPDQKRYNKNVGRPTKRQRLGNDLNAADDSEASSDSDKEHGLTKYYSAAMALTDSPEEKKRRENRSKRFDKGHGNRAKNNNSRIKEAVAGNLYAKRAITSVLNRSFDESGSKAVEDIDWDALIVKGTCQEIEKRYLRLTSAPDPATVRPEEVLEKALLMVRTSPKNYLYKCDQLKSIRQDLTVQHIHNELTVEVYETHARLAIEAGDLPEYNQCQSQLQTLYAEGIKGCHMEFAAYNLLCVILHSNNSRDLVSAMSRLPADAKRDEAVLHALSVRTAVTSGNYVMFFRLYKKAPYLSTFLMDLHVEKMRYAAVKCICRSYRPTVPVSYLSQILGFGSALRNSEASGEKEMDGVDECVEWLKAHGASFTSDNSEGMLLDTKTSVSSLFMPEPEDAVSHGDANLAVNDFLTRSLA